MSQTIFASAARTATATSPNFSSVRAKGGLFTIDVTSISGTTPAMTISVQHYDSISQKYITLLTSASISTVSTTVLAVYPGIASVANQNLSLPLGDEFRVVATITGTTPSVTFTVSFDGAN